MRKLRYSINVTLDGCCDHQVGIPDEESHRYWAKSLQRADALLFGRVTYEMMEQAWRKPADGNWPEWMDDGDIAFAESIGAATKFVVSSKLTEVAWNSHLLRGELGEAVRQLKEEPGDSLFVGGVSLPSALADMGLIDEYEFVLNPVIAGHGPRLLDGLRERINLELVGSRQFGSGAMALTYRPIEKT